MNTSSINTYSCFPPLGSPSQFFQSTIVLRSSSLVHVQGYFHKYPVNTCPTVDKSTSHERDLKYARHRKRTYRPWATSLQLWHAYRSGKVAWQYVRVPNILTGDPPVECPRQLITDHPSWLHTQNIPILARQVSLTSEHGTSKIQIRWSTSKGESIEIHNLLMY